MASGDERRAVVQTFPFDFRLLTKGFRLTTAARLWLVPSLLILAAGCGDDEGPPRYHVSGAVTFQGEPVPMGSIMFQPDATAGNSGPTGSATIRNGSFDTRLEGEPQTGGPQIVMVEAFDGKVEQPDYAPYGGPLIESFQQRYELPDADTTLDIELTLPPE